MRDMNVGLIDFHADLTRDTRRCELIKVAHLNVKFECTANTKRQLTVIIEHSRGLLAIP